MQDRTSDQGAEHAERPDAHQDETPQDEERTDIHRAQVPAANHSTSIGACRCPRWPGFTLGDCTCEWGRALDLIVRYGWNATDETLADQIGNGIVNWIAATIMAGRASALRRLAARWRSSRSEFCSRYGLSSARLGQLGIKIKDR